MVQYPANYPEANKLESTQESKAQKDFGSLGALPLGSIKEDGGIKETFFDAVGHKEAAESKARNKALKKGDAKTVGSKEFDKGIDPVKAIKQFDPKNTSGAIPFALNLVNQIKNNSGPATMLTDIVGSQMGGMMSQFTSLMQNGLIEQAMQLASKIQEGIDLKEELEQKARDIAEKAKRGIV
jgi:hypothetical protein